jgi:hypothetical protein
VVHSDVISGDHAGSGDPAGGGPAGGLPDGQAPDGQAPRGQAPDGQAPDGQAPEGATPEGPAPARGLTRRQLLTRAGAVAAGAAAVGIGGYAGVSSLGSPHRRAPLVQRFVSRPDLAPPALQVTGAADASHHLFIAAANAGPGQGGAMILDPSGGLVWFGPDTSTERKMDFSTQTFGGQPVLTWWEGDVVDGYGKGQAVIADTSYRVRHVVRAVGDDLMVDLHEFTLTPQGTALITAFRTSRTDLTSVGGSASDWVLSGVVQEIDVATGRLLFEWDSLDHVPVTDTYQAFTTHTQAKPFDYFHVNSIIPSDDGDLLVSARNTWAVYKIARPGGAIRWRLGGKNSSFAMGPGVRFYWQHHARPHPGGVLSLFDDGAAPKEEPQSRAILLDLDTTRMTASLYKQYVHPSRVLTPAMGSAQVLPDGGMFVGWGSTPRFSQFTPDGKVVFDAQLPVNDPTYRAFSYPWSGHPLDSPAAAARSTSANSATVYASWNGATNVAAWTVLGGLSRSSLATVGAGLRTGFETEIVVASPGPYFAVVALDASGRALGRSAPVRRDAT